MKSSTAMQASTWVLKRHRFNSWHSSVPKKLAWDRARLVGTVMAGWDG
jgi:hypothetical protein